jgi:hypothetical protein
MIPFFACRTGCRTEQGTGRFLREQARHAESILQITVFTESLIGLSIDSILIRPAAEQDTGRFLREQARHAETLLQITVFTESLIGLSIDSILMRLRWVLWTPNTAFTA